MIASPDYTVEQASIAAEQYLDTLRQAEAVTDDLCAAVENWDGDVVNSLLLARAGLCAQVGRMSADLAAMISGCGGEKSRIAAVVAKIEEGQARLMSKQQRVEQVLAAEMRKVEEGAKTLSNQRGLSTAYGSHGSARNARFVDSRL